MADELPPIIAQLLGDASQLFGVIDDAEARLEAFADQTFNPSLDLNIEQLDTGLADAQAAVQAFTDQDPTIDLGIDEDKIIFDLATIQTLISEVTKPTLINLGLDVEGLTGSLVYTKGLLQAFAAEQYYVTVNPEIASGMAIEEMQALEGTLAAMGKVPLDPIINPERVAALMAEVEATAATIKADLDRAAEVDVDVNPGSIGEAIIALDAIKIPPIDVSISQASLGEALLELGVFRTAAKAETADITASFGSLLAGIGFGGGSFTGIFSSIAGLFSGQFGSIQSLAGFGPEHLITTLLGLGGSAAGGALGGSLLGLSSLGVGATGLGTDLAGFGQAADDIKNVSSAMNALDTAVATYGQGSNQALAAQSQLNQALTSFNPIAQQAVETAAAGLGKIGNEFDAVTGQAEKMGAQIIISLEGVAEGYLPTIGKFATENTAIIQKALQPLFDWLKNSGTQGGLGIFNELEEIFQQHLPAAMGAFDNGIELLARTIALVAPYTGHFIDDLDRIFTRLNGTGWDKYSDEVIKLVNLFHVWSGFISILVRDTGALFSDSAGLGAGIIGELTGYLNQLHAAIDSAAGKDALERLFNAHKTQILDLIALVVELGQAFTSAYMVIAPTLTEITSMFLKLADVIVKIFNSNPVTKFLLGFAMLTITTKILTAAMADLIIKFLAFIGIDVAAWVSEAGGAIGILTTAFHVLGASAIEAGLDEEGALTGGAMSAGLTDFGVGAGEAAEGVGGLSLAMGGLATAAPLVVAGLGLAAGAFLIIKNANDGWAQSIAKLTGGVENLPTQTLPELQTALAATNAEIKKLTDTTTTVDKINHTARDSFGQNTQVVTKYGAAVDQLRQYAQSLEEPIKTQNDNLKTLSTTLGLSKTNAEALAASLNIQLGQTALTTTQVQRFAAALQKQDAQTGLSETALKNLAATAGTSTTAISGAVSNAMQTTQQAWQGFGNAVTNFAGATVPAGSAIKAFYAQSLTQAQTFNANIQKAIGQGYSAQLISQIEQAGPQESGFLQGLVNANGQGLQTLITQASNAISAEGVQAVQEARLTQEAVSAKSSEMTGDLSTALAISQALTTSNISASLTSLISHLSGGYAQFLKVANEYGIAIPNSIKAQLAATADAGNQAGAAVATSFGGGISSHTAAATAAAQGMGLGAINAIKNGSAGAFAVGQSLSTGVAEGIINQQQAAFAAAHNLGIGTVNAMKDVVKPGSPSRVTAAEIGAPIAQGVALGMLQNAGLVTSAAKTILGGVFGAAGNAPSIGINAGRSIAPVQGSAGGTTTMVSQPVNIVVNGQTIASTVLDILLKSARARGNIFSQFGGSNATGTSTGINRTNAIAR